jgi:predicted acyltransferase
MYEKKLDFFFMCVRWLRLTSNLVFRVLRCVDLIWVISYYNRWVCNSKVSFRCLTIAEIKTHCLFDCIEVSCIWIAFGLHNSRLNLTKEGLFDWRRKVNLSLGNISLLLCGWFGDRGMISFSTTSEQRCMRVLQKFNRCCHSALQLSIRRG